MPYLGLPLLTAGLLVGLSLFSFPDGLEYPFADLLTGKISASPAAAELTYQRLGTMLALDTFFIIGFLLSWYKAIDDTPAFSKVFSWAGFCLAAFAGFLDILENSLVWVAFEQFNFGIIANDGLYFTWRLIQMLSYLFAFLGGMLMIFQRLPKNSSTFIFGILFGTASIFAIMGIFISGFSFATDLWYLVMLVLFVVLPSSDQHLSG